MKANHGAWALHRYWLWANQFRESLLESLAQDPPADAGQGREMMGWIRVPFQSASYWLATLHVVVEGWQELNLHDPRVDDLLRTNDRVSALRRYRNGVFHFQPTYFDTRVTDFAASGDAVVDWAHELHEAFGAWFLSWYASQPSSDETRRRDDL
jgi:hypothetical protein